MRSFFQNVVGAAVLAHVIVTGIDALPALSPAINRQVWADPTVQAELHGWHVRAVGWGYRGSAQQFQDDLYALTTEIVTVRKAILRPVEPYFDLLGTRQRWNMFVAPHRFPSRLRIEVERAGQWHLIYRRGDAQYRWSSVLLADDRLRSAEFRYAWPGFRQDYRRFASWLGRRALADFPAASRVRVSYERQRTPRPHEVLEGTQPEVKIEQRRTIERRP